jgi:aldehyde:ferredoxin oxidoreductase
MGGYVGKIARINLTTKAIRLIDTAPYEKWAGGRGIAAALFFDIAVREKGLDLEHMDHGSPHDGGFHPDNVVTITTSPFTGTGVPSGTGRIEVSGIGVHSYPIGWFTKSIIGGRFGAMLKYAGYDAVVIEGASAEPVWIDIRDGEIVILPCSDLGLWGEDTYETQKKIWAYVVGDEEFGSWISPAGMNGNTTQRPAVMTIGRAGENKCRMACIQHDAGYAAGAGGFGAVWGSKNLKAVSVIGSGSIPIADPAGLMAERIANVRDYGPDIANYKIIDRSRNMLRHNFLPGAGEAYGKTPQEWDGVSLRREAKRPASCMGCIGGCRGRYKSGKANEIRCAGCYFYGQADSQEIQVEATELINRYGFNTFDFYQGVPYLYKLAKNGILGPAGSEIETDLDFSTFGSLPFARRLLETIAERDTPFGDALAEGFARALKRWGRLDDIGDGLELEEEHPHVPLPYWGLPEHHYDARAQLDYGYGTILGDRETCEHLFTSVFWDSYWKDHIPGRGYDATAEEAVALIAEKMLPHASAYPTKEAAMQMINYATENMYSEHIARMVSWDRHCTRFFKASLLYCDWRYPDIINIRRSDKKGSSFTAEETHIRTVIGQNLSYLDCMRIGRKIWNLDNAIWALQGRHRDMVHFSPYLYKNPLPEEYKLPTYDPNAPSPSERWAYRDVGGRSLDKNEFEKFKTRYYAQEGWDTATGWPTRSTLESLGMGDVADTLQSWGKLGS